jgi:oxygen-independent coproporphyrinogen-3 oxidase
VAEAGLYVHVPFCIGKCPYCDFFSLPVLKPLVKEYLWALDKEALLISSQYPIEFHTLYIGGGTPSVLSSDQMDRLFAALYGHFNLSKVQEITVEVNPKSLTKNLAQSMKKNGVNRISLGVQSFNESQISVLQRDRIDKIYKANELLRESGFDNISFDLMYGIPGQDVHDWQETLYKAISLNPEHLSCYSLIIEEMTPFARLYADGILVLPDEDEEACMYESAMDILNAKGYEQYEISNFAKPGYQCRHNLIYWNNLQWLGLGPAAHSHVSGERFWNTRDMKDYLSKLAGGDSPRAGAEKRGWEGQRDETAILQLRLNEGIEIKAFDRRFGKDSFRSAYTEITKKLSSLGLLHCDNQRVRLTRKGRMLGNLVFQEFLRAED